MINFEDKKSSLMPRKTAKVDLRKSSAFGENKYPSSLNIAAMKKLYK